MVVKSTENRLAKSSEFIYNKINDLYAIDISERVLGLFSFYDGSESTAVSGVE